MRISDWSSDVCSSDLPAPWRSERRLAPERGTQPRDGYLNRTPVAAPRQAAPPGEGERIGDTLSFALLIIWARTRRNGRTFHCTSEKRTIQTQLTRAQWTARMGQYVQIPVVPDI